MIAIARETYTSTGSRSAVRLWALAPLSELINEWPPGKRLEKRLSGTIIRSTMIETIVAVTVKMREIVVPVK